MKISNDSYNQLKELYPNYKKAHELAKSGDKYLLYYLDGAILPLIHIDEVLSSIDLNELKQKAILIKRKLNLYEQIKKELNLTN